MVGQPLAPLSTASLVERAPVTADNVTIPVRSPEDTRPVCINYIESIVSLSTPLPPVDAACSTCGTSPMPLVANEASPAAYQLARRGTTPSTLSHCTSC